MVPETNYVKTPDGAYIAYQTTGDGPIDLMWQLDWLSNVDVIWEERTFERLFTALAGSGLAFEDAGEHELKGVPERWRLYRATPRA